MKRLFLILSIAIGLIITGCSSDESGHSHDEGSANTHGEETHEHSSENDHGHPHDSEDTTGSTHAHSEGGGEHPHSGEDAHSHESEESAQELGLEETYDQVQKGVRLILSYNNETSTFTGTVENTTQETLPQVSVGVELSNGTELGPTTPVNLEAGESQSVELDAYGETFDGWNGHSQMGSGGHSHGKDGDHEHHN